jgi:hypothetical protein
MWVQGGRDFRFLLTHPLSQCLKKPFHLLQLSTHEDATIEHQLTTKLTTPTSIQSASMRLISTSKPSTHLISISTEIPSSQTNLPLRPVLRIPAPQPTDSTHFQVSLHAISWGRTVHQHSANRAQASIPMASSNRLPLFISAVSPLCKQNYMWLNFGSALHRSHRHLLKMLTFNSTFCSNPVNQSQL